MTNCREIEREKRRERKVEREREKERKREREKEEEREIDSSGSFFTCDGLAAKIREAQWCLATEKLLGGLQVGIIIEAKIIIDHAK